MTRRMILALLICIGLGAVATPAHALEIRTAEQGVQVPQGTTIDDDLLAAGQSVSLAGQVNGDAYAFAQTVTLTGTVERDLIAAGQNVTIDGVVRGDLRVAAQNVTINGRVEGNVTSFGQVVALGPRGTVAGSVAGAAQDFNLRGPVTRGVSVAAETLQLGSTVGRDVAAHVERLLVEPDARIAGRLDYTSDSQMTVPPEVAAGGVQFHQSERQERRRERDGPPFGGLGIVLSLAWLCGSLVAGVLLVHFLPGFAAGSAAQVREHPLPSFGVGVLALFVIPVAALLVAITLVGLPLAFVAFLGYLLGLFVGWLLLGLAVGALLVDLVRRRAGTRVAGVDPKWLVVLGLVVLYVVTHVPLLGGLLAFVGTCIGVGALLRQLAALRERRAPAPALPPAA